MKFFQVLVLLTLILGCKKTMQPLTILSGRLDGLDSKHLYLKSSNDRLGWNAWLATLDTVVAAPDGTFRFAFPARAADFYQVVDEKGLTVAPDVYLAPGDSLFISRTKSASGAFSFDYQGAHADRYRYFRVRDSLRQIDPVYEIQYRDVYYLPQDSVAIVLGNQWKWEEAILDQYFPDTTKVDPIRRYAYDTRLYENLAQYYQYLYYHNYYTKDTFTYVMAEEPYYDFLKGVDLDYVPSGFFWGYNAFLSSYVQDEIQRKHVALSDSAKWARNIELRFDIIRSKLTGKAKDAALLGLTNEFSHGLEQDHFFDQLSEIDAYFQSNVTDTMTLNKFRHVAKDFERLRKGSAAPDIALPNVQGDTIRLSALKGKVVYIDFWGTWCFPCLKELPHSLKLQEALKGEAVEFVYIALEGGEDQVTEWKEFVTGKRTFDYAPFLEQREYPGIHLLSENQFANQQIQAYKINSAPSYVLIDSEGKIASARAIRPSNPEIETEIRKLLPAEN